jgi:hypothetical protein
MLFEHLVREGCLYKTARDRRLANESDRRESARQ